MLILIPPSEGKSSKNSSNTKFKDTNFIFKNEVKAIQKQLSNSDDAELQKIYGVTLQKAKQLNELNLNAMENNCSYSIERYTGVVYNQIDWQNLSDESKLYFEKNIRIFSGLFGIVTPKTLIPDYKLKMNSLSLTKFWLPILTKHLSKEDIIIDLLPQIHSKSYSHENIVRIDFKIIKDGKLKSAGHMGKVVKGQFIKFLCEIQAKGLDGLDKFTFDNYKWDGKNFIKTIT
jgi:Uncharacterized protein conserved in bacteria